MTLHDLHLSPNEAASFELPPDSYKMLVERAQTAMFVLQHGKFRFVNPRLCELVGFGRDELLAGIGPMTLVAPEHRLIAAEELRQRLTGVEGRPYNIRCVRKDGSSFGARLWGTLVHLDGAPASLVTLHDISELERVVSAEQRRSSLLAQTEELALIGSSEYDVASSLVSQSAGMFRVFGEPFTDQPVSGEWLMARVPGSEHAFVRGILSGVRPGVPCEFEHRIVHADGGLRTVVHRASAEVDASGEVVRVIGILQDVTAQRVAEHQRDLLARSDAVTRLPNRLALLDHVAETIRKALRDERQIALAILEIGQLQLVNESLGYAAGDQLLLMVAERLQECLGEDDMLAQVGSGRFAVVLSRAVHVDEPTAVAVSQSLVNALALPMVVAGTEVLIRCAAGVSLCPRDGQVAEKLLHQAEAAMHRAREEGGSGVCVYSAEVHGKAANQLAREAAMRGALERGEFYLLYQPQLDLATGAMIGVEALIRWNDPVRGQVSPVEFIPLAEETGLILPIGEWVLRTACAQGVAWQRAGLPPLRIAVNLSVRQLQQPDLSGRIQAILLETGLAPSSLGLEITESVLMMEHGNVARTLEDMRAIGVEISLDDFGTGYSNLSYLRTLPIDVVKIDRSFVHDVSAAPQDVSMTRAVITMAHSLQKKVLAEGVETEGQVALLIANGCDQMQGYFFSRPVSADAVAELSRERRQLPEHLLARRMRKRTLLLVDDEDNIVSALKRLLRGKGYNVVSANSGAQGLQRLAEHPVDVILSDQRMPGMTGVEFLRRAKVLYPDTVRMVLSGYTELQSITDAVNEGAIYKFLTKPWDDDRLCIHIEEAFEHKELSDENRRLGVAVKTAHQQLESVNVRLESLLRQQRERHDREQTSLLVSQDLLHRIPAPLIGVDASGMVAFLNDDAHDLFPSAAAMLGRQADEALPAALRPIWAEGDGVAHRIDLGGRRYQAVCRAMSPAARSQGKLLVLTPELPH